MTTAITPLLRTLADAYPPHAARASWDAVVDEASKQRYRGAGETALADQLAQLRQELRGEVVAFHTRLDVKSEGGGDGKQTWTIGIPITLFPKRDQGFVDVKCAMQFDAAAGGQFRVLKALPLEKSDVVAEAALGAELQVEASGKMGAPIALPVGSTVASASAKVYGNAKTKFNYTLRRKTVECAVVRGTGALWRLENTSRPEELAAESHSLAVVIETVGDCSLNAAGYLSAASQVQWLTSSVGRMLENLGDAVHRFFNAGAPVEAYGQWTDILH